MLSPIHAMLWELWRTSRLSLLLRLGAMSAMMLFVGLVARSLAAPEIQVVSGVAVMMMIVSGFFSELWLNEIDSNSNGFCFRLGFVRPVSTWLLVAVPLVYTIAYAIVCYLIPALLLRYGFNMPVPLLGPSAVIAIVVLLATSIIWSATNRTEKMIGLMILAALLVGFSIVAIKVKNSPDPILFSLGRPDFFDFSLLHYTAMTLTMAIVSTSTVFAVDRQRHGERWITSRSNRIRHSISSASRTSVRPFRSATAAQCWYEWRRFGAKVLIAGAVAAMLVVVFLTLGGIVFPARNPNIEVWLGALAMSPFVFQLIGADGAVGLNHKQGTTHLSLFDATRSMANDQLIAVKLLVIAVSSLAGWLCMASAAGIHMFCFGNWNEWTVFRDAMTAISTNPQPAWWLVGLANLLLVFVSSSSSLLAFGLWISIYPGRFFVAIFVLTAHVCMVIWGLQHKWHFPTILSLYGYVLAILVVAVCVATIRKALISKSLGRLYFFVSCGFWGIYVVSTVVLYFKATVHLPFSVPSAALALGAALLMVPLATTAMAPLAYASHRHHS